MNKASTSNHVPFDLDRLNPASQKSIAITLFMLAIVTLYLGLIRPLIGLNQELNMELASLAEKRWEYEVTAGQRGAWETELVAVTRRSNITKQYLPKNTTALASAKMQQILKQIVRRAGSELTKTSVIENSRQGVFVPITVRTSLQGNLEATQKIVHALESGEPMFFLNNLNIFIGPRERRLANSDDNRNVLLQIDFDLTSYMFDPEGEDNSGH